MIITTTETIGERKIRGYCGIVYGTDIYLVGGMLGGGLVTQENLFGRALETAKSNMKSRALELGANAIIGVKVNMSSPGSDNHMIVTITGTAVIVSGPTQDEWFAGDASIPYIDEPISDKGRYSRNIIEKEIELSENSPIKINKAAILIDKHSKKEYVQCSISNCSDIDIDVVVLCIKLYDKNGVLIDEGIYPFEGEFLADNESHNILASAETSGAKYAEFEYVEHIVSGSEFVAEDVDGFVICPKCNTKQKSSPSCKRCNVPLYVEKYDPDANHAMVLDKNVPILVKFDENGHVKCPNCGRVQTKKSSCYACMQRFLLPGEKPAENEIKDNISVKDSIEEKQFNINNVFVSVDAEGWLICPKCNTRQKASASCKRCGVLFHNPGYDFGESHLSAIDAEEEAHEDVSPENVVVRPDENGCITCPHCGKYQSKKKKCFVCKQPINIEE